MTPFHNRKYAWLGVACLALAVLAPASASAGLVYSFSNITTSTGTSGGNYQVTVFGQGDAGLQNFSSVSVGANQVAFVFQNPNPVGSITRSTFRTGRCSASTTCTRALGWRSTTWVSTRTIFPAGTI